MKRYFVYKKGSSDKFWCVELINNTLIINFGRTGTTGRTITTKFTTKAICKTAFNKLIKEKTTKGYKETKAKPAQSIKPTSDFIPMNKKNFWSLINSSVAFTNIERQANYLKKELKKLSRKDLVAFDYIFNRLINDCYNWNLWAAAYTIHAGCSDDSFVDFRAWLITRGQSVFEKALRSSDSLAELNRKKLAQSNNGEHLLYLASTVYEDIYDDNISNDEYTKPFKVKTIPSGREWEEGDINALKKINPSLFRLFATKPVPKIFW